MTTSIHRHYFLAYSDSIMTSEIFAPLDAAEDDRDVARIVVEMDQELMLVFGGAFRLRFDATAPSRDTRRRVFLFRSRGSKRGS